VSARVVPPKSRLRDAVGVVHEPAGPEARSVCLVPSITELICELGLAAQLVGRTGFCIHPRETVRTIPKLGGTKDVSSTGSVSSPRPT
jgi:ABC-type hemin transport system substrate-binding protein